MMQLETVLTQLEFAQLVRRVSEEELTYVFKHALVQETASELMLKNRRRDVHRLVAQSIEELYSDQLDENAARLAQHFAEAGDDARTFQYATRAGDVATRRSANTEARIQYDIALDALSRLSARHENRGLRIDLGLKRVNVTSRAEGPHRTLVRLRELESLATELVDSSAATRDDRLRLARTRYWIAQAFFLGGQVDEAFRYLHQVLTIADAEQGGAELRGIPRSTIGRALEGQGRFAEAEPYLRAATSLVDKFATNHEWVSAHAALGLSIAAQGNYSAGVAEAERARLGAIEANNPTSQALSNLLLCPIYFMGNDVTMLAQASQAVIDTAEQTDEHLMAYIGYGLKAIAQSRLSDNVGAVESMAHSMEIGQTLGPNLLMRDWFAAGRAEIALNSEKFDTALELAQQAVALSRQMKGLFGEGLAQRVWAQALARQQPPQYDEAEKHFAEAVRAFEQGNARLEAARTHFVWGKILAERNEHAKAKTHLEQAAAQFEKSNMMRELNEIRAINSQ